MTENIESYCYKHFLKQDDIVYDIGAHIGQTANLFIQKGAKIVYAFEASVLNFSTLEKNTKNKNIVCYNVALNDKEYECNTRFKDCVPSGGDAIQHIVYKRLDNFVETNGLELPDFIKIDIEGMESIVFNTFDFLFAEKRPIFFTEIHVAASRNAINDYVDNPNWRHPSEGGYDFNNLKLVNYCYIDDTLKIVKDGDFNPPKPCHLGRIFIPIEKLDIYLK